MPRPATPCTGTLDWLLTPGGGPVQCTRKAGHPENHVGPRLGDYGRAMWTDWNTGATPHREQPGPVVVAQPGKDTETP